MARWREAHREKLRAMHGGGGGGSVSDTVGKRSPTGEEERRRGDRRLPPVNALAPRFMLVQVLVYLILCSSSSVFSKDNKLSGDAVVETREKGRVVAGQGSIGRRAW